MVREVRGQGQTRSRQEVRTAPAPPPRPPTALTVHASHSRLKEHISVPDNPPILIFPEGTCINNTSVMQFKKGSFEVGGTIYPVAIK